MRNHSNQNGLILSQLLLILLGLVVAAALWAGFNKYQQSQEQARSSALERLPG